MRLRLKLTWAVLLILALSWLIQIPLTVPSAMLWWRISASSVLSLITHSTCFRTARPVTPGRPAPVNWNRQKHQWKRFSNILCPKWEVNEMNEWMNEWMNESVDEWMKKRYMQLIWQASLATITHYYLYCFMYYMWIISSSNSHFQLA